MHTPERPTRQSNVQYVIIKRGAHARVGLTADEEEEALLPKGTWSSSPGALSVHGPRISQVQGGSIFRHSVPGRSSWNRWKGRQLSGRSEVA